MRRMPRDAALIALSVLATILLAALMWFLGADVLRALLLGAATTVIAVAALHVLRERDLERFELRWTVDDRANRVGSRDDVANLSWSLRAGWGYVGRTAELKLRHIARRRLELEGLNLDDVAHRARIEARIGADMVRLLTRENVRGLRLTTMTVCLDRLDGLDGTHYPAPAAPARRRLRFPAWRERTP